MMQISLTNIRYRCDPDLHLQDLPHDVFVQLCKAIDQTFVNNTNSVIFGSYDSVEELRKDNGSYDIEKAVFLLGDKEGWTVRDITKVLFKINNRLALKHILCFWPPRILKPPPSAIYLSPGQALSVSVEVTGFPDPHVLWCDPNGEPIGEGAQLHFDGEIQIGTYCVQLRSWDPLDSSEFNDSAFFQVENRSLPYSVVGPTSQLPVAHHWPEPAQPSPVATGATRTPQSPVRPSQPPWSSPQRSPVSAGFNFNLMPPAGPMEVSKSSHEAIGKVALLVGMGAYHSSSYTPLGGPSQDLYDLAAKLAQIGFRVFTLRDLDLKDLTKAVNIYADLLNPGVYGVLYLSGHGVRFPGRSDDFLLPVDTPANKKIEHCLSRRKVIAELQKRRPNLNLVIWDACRERAREPMPFMMDETTANDNMIYGESNLFEFRSSVAFTKSFESKNRSLIILPLLNILGDMSVNIPMTTLLTRWKDDVDAGGYQTSAIMIGGRSQLSLWDPVVRRTGHTEHYFRILRLWSEGYALDENQVFPRLDFIIDQRFSALSQRVSVCHQFLVHNQVEITLDSLDRSLNITFNLQQLRQILDPCKIQPIGTVFSHHGLDHCCTVLISNLEKLAKPNTLPQVKLPISIYQVNADGNNYFESFIIISHIRLIELFQHKT